MKGQLYLPESHTNSDIPSWISLYRRIGHWGQTIQPHSHHYYRLERHEWLCPNEVPTSDCPTWWTDGLYYQAVNNAFYMYRAPTLIQHYKSTRNDQIRF